MMFQMMQSVQMGPMVRSVYTTVHRTVRILPVTSLQKMVCVQVESANQDSKDITVLKVCFINFHKRFNVAAVKLRTIEC